MGRLARRPARRSRRRGVEDLRNLEVAVGNFSRATGAGAEIDQTPSARHGIEFSIFEGAEVGPVLARDLGGLAGYLLCTVGGSAEDDSKPIKMAIIPPETCASSSSVSSRSVDSRTCLLAL